MTLRTSRNLHEQLIEETPNVNTPTLRTQANKLYEGIKYNNDVKVDGIAGTCYQTTIEKDGIIIFGFMGYGDTAGNITLIDVSDFLGTNLGDNINGLKKRHCWGNFCCNYDTVPSQFAPGNYNDNQLNSNNLVLHAFMFYTGNGGTDSTTLYKVNPDANTALWINSSSGNLILTWSSPGGGQKIIFSGYIMFGPKITI